MDIEINCTYVNLGLLLLFLGKMVLIHGYFIRFFVVCSVLFSYITRSKAGECVHSHLTNLSPIKELLNCS